MSSHRRATGQQRDRWGRFHRHVWKYSGGTLSSCSQRMTSISAECRGDWPNPGLHGCYDTQTVDVPGRFKCEITIDDLRTALEEIRDEASTSGAEGWAVALERCNQIARKALV